MDGRVIFDIQKEKMKPHINLGAVPGKNIKETVQEADIVITMLPSTENVNQLLWIIMAY